MVTATSASREFHEAPKRGTVKPLINTTHDFFDLHQLTREVQSGATKGRAHQAQTRDPGRESWN